MISEVFLATGNVAKIERFKNLLEATGLQIKIHTPLSLGIKNVDVEENGKTLRENAEIKSRAYFGRVDMPILANDTGFWVEGEGLIDAPKRHALQGMDESTLTKDQVGELLLKFWKDVATQKGGRADAAWIESFVLIDEDGKLFESDSKREVILTDKVYGDPHVQMPVRCLYISKTTNKPAIQHTKEEELLEMKPVVDALHKLLG